jgi:hypothetical protein
VAKIEFMEGVDKFERVIPAADGLTIKIKYCFVTKQLFYFSASISVIIQS